MAQTIPTHKCPRCAGLLNCACTLKPESKNPMGYVQREDEPDCVELMEPKYKHRSLREGFRLLKASES